jgi:hypothetical protein
VGVISEREVLMRMLAALIVAVFASFFLMVAQPQAEEKIIPHAVAGPLGAVASGVPLVTAGVEWMGGKRPDASAKLASEIGHAAISNVEGTIELIAAGVRGGDMAMLKEFGVSVCRAATWPAWVTYGTVGALFGKKTPMCGDLLN